MNANKINEVSKLVVGRAFVVSNTLGSGFLEKIYENALALELSEAGLLVKQQYDIAVYYRGAVVGAYTADLLVENCVLIELKAIESIRHSPRGAVHELLESDGSIPLPIIEFRSSARGNQTAGERPLAKRRLFAFICGSILQSERLYDNAERIPLSSAWISKYRVASGRRWPPGLPAPV